MSSEDASDRWVLGPFKVSKREYLFGLGGLIAGTGMAGATDADGDSGKMYGGTDGMEESYNAALQGENQVDLWIGPDSAKSNVAANSGRVFKASDTQVDYYGDNGSWVKLGIGSSSEPVPSVNTDDLAVGGAGGYLKDRAMVVDTGTTYQSAETAAANAPADGTVLIGEGTFGQISTDNVSIADGVTIKGVGRGTLIDGGAGNAIKVEGVNDITIRDLDTQTNVTGSDSDTWHGIWMVYNSPDGLRNRVDNVVVRQANYGGIEYGAGHAGSPDNIGCIVTNCRARDINDNNGTIVHAFGGPAGNQKQLWANLQADNIEGRVWDGGSDDTHLAGLIAWDCDGQDGTTGASAVMGLSGEGVTVRNAHLYNCGVDSDRVFNITGDVTLLGCTSHDSNVSVADYRTGGGAVPTLIGCHSYNGKNDGYSFDGSAWVVRSHVANAGVNAYHATGTASDVYLTNPSAAGTSTWDIRAQGGPVYVRDPDLTGAGNGKAPSGDAANIYWNGILGGGPLGGVDLSSVNGNDDGDLARADGTATGVTAYDLAVRDAGNTQWIVFNQGTTV